MIGVNNIAALPLNILVILISFRRVFASKGNFQSLKRLGDLLFSIVLLFISSPLLIVSAC